MKPSGLTSTAPSGSIPKRCRASRGIAALVSEMPDAAGCLLSGPSNSANPSATQSIDVDVAGASQLKLVVLDAGNGNSNDHADWMNAHLTTQPTVAASAFRFETAPHLLQFTFRGNVKPSLSAGDLSVIDLTTNTPIEALSLLTYDTQANQATFAFTGFSNAVLPDGRYRATLGGARVRSGTERADVRRS